MSNTKEIIKIRIAQRRWQNEIFRKDIDYCSTYRPKKKSKSKKATEYLKLPQNFSIYSADENKYYKDTMNIISAISRAVDNDVKKIHLDFSQTKTIKVAAILILYATIENAIDAGINFRITSFSKEPKATEIIKRSGIHFLCKENKHIPKFDGEFIPVISGSGGAYRDDIVDFIQHQIYKSKMSPSTESKYGGAVQEAINNVAYHAYPNIHDSFKKKWWVMCDLAGDQLFLAIYDIGVGIPETVMKRAWYENVLKNTYPEQQEKITAELSKEGMSLPNMLRYKLSDKLGIVSDAMKIAVSMVGDITGTESSKHGQGSKSIKALVTENKQGTLWIYSNNGLYKLCSGKVKTHDLPIPVLGTLLQWNIKVNLDDN
ncbi:ATP-binding protein [Aeromonas hydrophila]|uniref:ATP-binding protein n=1 Tax=Aeromonas hydrophila TaxID=644 RepID=UPI001117A67B|nr:ATP-binding protein [Aeromonas hydrophila]TNH77712.1 ATP-binding protein [Aeromonas hydrophila]